MENLAADPALTLWYRQPAEKWVEALPIGNGRLGAMIFGGTDEHIQFNGGNSLDRATSRVSPRGAVEYLPVLRRLLAEGKQKEAEQLATEKFMSIPLRLKAYQPFGDVWLLFPGHTNVTHYRRELDLDSAVAKVSYEAGGVRFERKMFSSYPDQVIVGHITANKPGSISFQAKLNGAHESCRTVADEKNELTLSGEVQPDGVRHSARLRLINKGGRILPSKTHSRLKAQIRF